MNVDFYILTAKKLLGKEPTGHDFGHIMRVYKLALKIAKYEKNIDFEILKTAVLLHDIAYSKGFFKGEHGNISAKIAKPILIKSGFPKAKINKVLKAIELHNYWFHKEKTASIEAKILRDADRLEAIGYNGILRMALYCSNAKKDIMEELKDLSSLETQFETREGKKLAHKRMKIVREFIANLPKE